jgi:predicted lipid carrier protein YhbT
MLGVSGLGEFLVAFAINLVPMFLLNGMLTGLFTDRALVQYNPLEFSNIRIGTFPVEDLGFGFAFLYGVEVLSSVIRK